MSGECEWLGMKRLCGSGFLLDLMEKFGVMVFGRLDYIVDVVLFLGCLFCVGWGLNGVFYYSLMLVGLGGMKNGLFLCI